MVVEIDELAESLLDARLTRRLVKLELADVDVPVEPLPKGAKHHASLFFRVFVTPTGLVRVELWDRGEFHGARSLSPTYGSPQLRARRIALAAAELARGLRQKRLAEARLAARPKKNNDAAEHETRVPPYRFDLAARGGIALVGPGDAWLAGPGLGAGLHVGKHARLELGAAWLAGSSAVASPSAKLRWLELSLAPSWDFALARRTTLGAGIVAAASAVHVSGVAGVDDVAGEADTWSSRAAGRVALGVQLSRAVSVALAPEVGAVLRRVPFVDQGGAHGGVGGLWLGATLGVAIDPSAPR